MEVMERHCPLCLTKKNKSMKHAFISVACCMLGFPLWGQYSLSGRVQDAKGNILAGAAVVIQHSYLGATTGPDGRYEFKNLKPGNLTLEVSFLGYNTQVEEVDIHSDTQQDFVLQPASLLGDEVVVKATRMTGGETVANFRLDKKAIQALDQGQDIPFILQLTPSVVATSDAGTGIGYTNLRIRGTDSYRINVTVNGIPVNDAESHGVWWVDFPDLAASTDNIHVQRGVGSSTNGAGAFGGTISLQTTTLNRDPYAEADYSGGSFNTHKRDVKLGTGLINNRYTFDARLSWLDSDGYIDRAFTHMKSWFITGASYGKGSILRFNAFSGTEKTYQAWYGIQKSILDTNRTYNPYHYDDETDNYTQTNYQLLYSKEISSSLYLSTALHYTHGEGYFENYNAHDSLYFYNLMPLDSFVTADLITRRWMKNDFFGATYSLNYRMLKMDILWGGGWNKYLGDHFGQVIWAAWAANNQIRHEWYRGTGDKGDFNTYLKLNYHPLETFSIYTDLQYRRVDYTIAGTDEHWDASGNQARLDQRHFFNFFNPKLGIFFHPAGQVDYYLSFSTGHREPTRSNYVDAILQPDQPRPETLYDYEAGVNLNQKNARMNLNLYYMDYYDQLVFTGKLNEVAYPIMVNVPRSYRMGVEFSTAVRIADKVTWDANLTLSENKILHYLEQADYLDGSYQYLDTKIRDIGTTDISYSPGLTGSSRIMIQPIPQFTVSLLTKYVGSQYFDNTSSPDRQIPAYFVNDLNLNYTMHPKWLGETMFELQVLNLFNARYENNATGYYFYVDNRQVTDSYWFPQAGIHFLAGVKVHF